MKQVFKILLLLLSLRVVGQENNQTPSTDLSQKEYKDSLIHYDFSSIWTKTDNDFVYGFVGKNFQRLQIKIISIIKNKIHEDTYDVKGKSLVKNNICQFTGTIEITSLKIYKNMPLRVDGNYNDSGIQKMGVLLAEYRFMEDSNQINSGVFSGNLSTYWYISKNGELRYDDTFMYADGYCNNQFVGIWKGYKKSSKLTCNWGDYRIPFSKDLDIGAGEFSPNEKYCQYGWQSICKLDSLGNKHPEGIKQEWWK